MSKKITIIKKDLFDHPGYIENNINTIVLCHGVNCAGAFGAGIAVKFKEKFPQMYNKYNALCRRNLIIPGDCWAWNEKDDSNSLTKRYIIYNLAIKSHWKYPAMYSALEKSLLSLESDIVNKNLQYVAMPWIGCGLGGLDKKIVNNMLEPLAKHTNICIYEQ